MGNRFFCCIRAAAAVCTLALPVTAAAQSVTSGTVARTGHVYNRSDVWISPGQVLTLFGHNMGASITKQVKASETPLPTTLAGISVDYVLGNTPTPAPIFLVQPIQECWYSLYCDRLIAITIQVPYELGRMGVYESLPTYFLVKENGVVRAIIGNFVWGQVPRIITRRDLINDFYPDMFLQGAATVRHLDGSPVTPGLPARPGEIVLFYATGLGGSPGSRTGFPAETAGDPSVQFALDYEFGLDPPPKKLQWEWGWPVPERGLVSAKAVPGKIGIYEIRFRVPEKIPEGTPRCGMWDVNLKVSIGWSFGIGASASSYVESVGICVEATEDPPPPFVPPWF